MRRVVFVSVSLAVVTCALVSSADEPPHAAASVAAEIAAEQASARADVDGALRAMRAATARVREALRAARKRGRPAEVACADAALSRADVALRRARDAGDRAVAAYARGDVDEGRRARGLLAEWTEAERLAVRDAASCGSGVAGAVVPGRTATTVRVSIDPRIPNVDDGS